MGMFPNMFGMNPSSINLNAEPAQIANSQIDGDLTGSSANSFFPGMYAGMLYQNGEQ